jgi:hypothetical protein
VYRRGSQAGIGLCANSATSTTTSALGGYHGGNRNKVSWKMIGFPGLPATYANVIEPYRNRRYDPEPQSVADFS